MEVKPRKVTVRELVEGYVDNDERGIFGYGGKLDIRPPYQRGEIYKVEEQVAVINTLRKRHPLNAMYWAECDDGKFEIIDGQQRTISICKYVNNKLWHNKMKFENLQKDQQDLILNYDLMVYQCQGTDSEKLEWFETINIAGQKLTPQELRNAVYHGSWVADAKRYFSKTGGPAQNLGGNYVEARVNRQEMLETAIDWLSKGNVTDYMSEHQHDQNAKKLWNYFEGVINWVKEIFPNYRKEMKGVDWGMLYREFCTKQFDPEKLEVEISRLLTIDDITKPKGVYPYVLTRDETHLSIRSFTKNQKRKAFEKQKGKCKICKKQCGDVTDMHADHIKPWHQGGKTVDGNCQMLCVECNLKKSSKNEAVGG